MVNPFNPGAGSIPPYLAGRDHHLSKFLQFLKEVESGKQKNLMLTGFRGTGKSTLMVKFQEMCLKNNFFPISKNQFTKQYSIPEEFLRALKYYFKNSLEEISRKKKFIGKMKAVGEYVKPSRIGIEGTYYEPSYSRSLPPFEDEIKEYLTSNWQVFEKSKFNGAIFLFDEFHDVRDLGPGKGMVLSDFIGVINELQKDGYHYAVVFSGLPILQYNIKKAKTFAERMFTKLEVRHLTESETKDAITIPLKGTGYSFSSELVKQLISDTGRYPFFIQYVCSEIITRINKKRLQLSDYRKIRPGIVYQLESNVFDSRFSDTSKTEKKILFAMAKANTLDIPMKIIKKSGVARGTLTKSLIRLESKELIYNYDRGVYRFSLPLLQDYLRRKKTDRQ